MGDPDSSYSKILLRAAVAGLTASVAAALLLPAAYESSAELDASYHCPPAALCASEESALELLLNPEAMGDASVTELLQRQIEAEAVPVHADVTLARQSSGVIKPLVRFCRTTTAADLRFFWNSFKEGNGLLVIRANLLPRAEDVWVKISVRGQSRGETERVRERSEAVVREAILQSDVFVDTRIVSTNTRDLKELAVVRLGTISAAAWILLYWLRSRLVPTKWCPPTALEIR